MTLRATVTELTWALPESVANARASWRERRSLLITLEDAKGAFGQGEAAPLPGYSDHDLVSCRDAFARHSPAMLAPLDELPLTELGPAITRAWPSAPPELRFAIETALLDLRARRAGRPLHLLLRELWDTSAPLTSLSLVALVSGEPHTWETRTRAALDAGYVGVKVKVGSVGARAAELQALSRVRAVLGLHRPLRLDANGTLDTRALDDLAAFEPEFVEEPMARGNPWPEHPPVPIALDESLRDGLVLDAELVARHRVVACVVKLAPLGGFFRALELARAAARAGSAIVLSHALEGPIGMAAAAEAALAFGSSRFAPGLAPHGALSRLGLPAAYAGATLVPHGEPGLGLPRIGG